MTGNASHLDEVDRQILYYLQDDARNVTQTEIGELIDVSPTTVGNRIDALETSGVIKTYYPSIDYDRAGFPHRILLFCTTEKPSQEPMATDLLDVRGVTSVRELVSGERNVHVEIVARSRCELVEVIADIGASGIDVNGSEIVRDEVREPFDGFGPAADR